MRSPFFPPAPSTGEVSTVGIPCIGKTGTVRKSPVTGKCEYIDPETGFFPSDVTTGRQDTTPKASGDADPPEPAGTPWVMYGVAVAGVAGLFFLVKKYS